MKRSRRRAGLGSNFYKLWCASGVSNLGDGVTLAAGPLLIASRTDDPALVAGAVFVQQLPWLLFSLPAGAYVDRVHRGALVVLVNLLRGAAVGGIALSLMLDLASIPVIYVALFVLGTGETLADNASTALLPQVVQPEQLSAANSRLHATTMLGNHFLGPPLGALLFIAGAALPFAFDAFTFSIAAAFVATISTKAISTAALGTGNYPKRSLRSELSEGLRWFWGHPVRILAICLFVMNITFSSAFAIYVLYAKQRLGVGPAGYGMLITVSGIGGLVGTGLVTRLEKRFGITTLLRIGLVIETLTHLALAVAREVWVVAGIMTVFGVQAVVWMVITLSVRQRLVPNDLLGRVNGAFYLLGMGGNSLGALAGGLVAREFGITAPFWVAGGVMAVLVVITWTRLGSVDITKQETE